MRALAQDPQGTTPAGPAPSPMPGASAPGGAAAATDSRAPQAKLPEDDLDLLTLYKDNYFLTGFSSTTEVKFQFSAKFDIWPNRGPHAVYFAFTLRSLWDVYRASQPFRENNYEPELLYTYYHVPGRYDPLAGCGFFLERFGFLHSSDGLGGDTSRGWNRVYGESRYACYNAARNYILTNLELWAPLLPEHNNENITQYEGYGELSLSVGRDSGQGALGDWDFTVHGRKGTLRRLDVGSVELDVRWRPRYGDLFRFTPYLYGQIFSGYGETLLNYNRSLSAVRVGIGFTDRSTRSE
jgi:phospholipase A1